MKFSKKADIDSPPCVCGCKLKDHYFAGTPEEFCKFCAPDCMKYRPQVEKKADSLSDPIIPYEEAEERGSKEVSQFDPEYDFLLRLIKVISKVAPEAVKDIKELSLSQPFVTIDDVGDLASKIWTLATEKYHIPHNWLVKQLPEKKASLKKADLWPAQAASENTLSHEHNSLSYNPLQEPDLSVSGPKPIDVKMDLAWSIISDKFFTSHERWSSVVSELKSQIPSIFDEDIKSLKDKVRQSLDTQMSVIASKKQATSNSNFYKVMNQVTNEMMKELNITDPNLINEGYCGDWASKVEELVPGVKSVSYTMGRSGYPHVVLEYDGRFYDSATPKGVSDLKDLNHVKGFTNDPEYKNIYWDDTFEEDLPSIITISKKKSLNIDKVVQVLNSKEPKVVYVDLIKHIIELEDGSKITFDEATKRALDIDKTGVFTGAEFSTTEFNVNPTLDNGPFSSPQDQGADEQSQPFPNSNWVPADDENQDEQPWSNIAASKNTGYGQCARSEATWRVKLFDGRGVQYFPDEQSANKYYEVALKEDKDPSKPEPYIYKKAFCKKQANPATRYWIAPDGIAYPVQGAHSWWMMNNPDILKKYGITPMQSKEDLQIAYQDMFDEGWIRISNEPMGKGFQIELSDLSNIPDYLNDFIAQHYKRGDTILIGNGRDPGVEVRDPFPTIQKAIHKRADLSGQTINKILQGIQANGGITYNLQQGNLSGTPNYAVSTHQDRERIVDGVDFDILEGYINDNQDLLNESTNSFGAWANGGKVYLDVISVFSDKDYALQLARENNQLAIWDLANNKEISTGIQRQVAFSKKEFIKQAEEQILT